MKKPWVMREQDAIDLYSKTGSLKIATFCDWLLENKIEMIDVPEWQRRFLCQPA